MFYVKYSIYLICWLALLGAPTLLFFLEKNGRVQEFELVGWLESDYNFVVIMILVVAGIMCFLNLYME